MTAEQLKDIRSRWKNFPEIVALLDEIERYDKALEEANEIYLLRDSWKPMNELASQMNEVLEKALKGDETA